jgi:hypothetical protein
LRERWALGAILVAGGVLRLLQLDEGLAIDEVRTLVAARDPWTELPGPALASTGRGAYALLAKLSALVGGESTIALRAPAVALGFASLLALWHFALLIAPRRQALWATAIMALGAPHLWYSQFGTGATGALLCVLLASREFVRLWAHPVERPQRAALLYAVWMALAGTFQLACLWFLAGHAGTWLGARLRVSGARPLRHPRAMATALVLAAAASALLHAPALVGVLQDSLSARSSHSLDEAWELLRVAFSEAWSGLPGRAGVPTLFLGAAVVCLGAVSYWRQGRALIAGMFAGPALAAASAAWLGCELLPRDLFPALGFALLVCVRGLARWVRLFLSETRQELLVGSLERALLSLACGVSAAGLARAWGPKQDFAGALAFVQAQAQAADTVVAVGAAALVYREWLPTDWPAAATVQQLQELEDRPGRTWVVACSLTELQTLAPELRKHLEESYAAVVSYPGTRLDGEVQVLAKSGP